MKKITEKLEEMIDNELGNSSFNNEECKEILEDLRDRISNKIDACEEEVYK